MDTYPNHKSDILVFRGSTEFNYYLYISDDIYIYAAHINELIPLDIKDYYHIIKLRSIDASWGAHWRSAKEAALQLDIIKKYILFV